MIHPVAIAIIRKGDRYLMTKRVDFDPEDKINFPYAWQFPGGGMEFGETPEDAVKREMIEEIGVEVEIIALIPKIEIDVRSRWQGLFIVYLCKLKNSLSVIKLNHEATDFGWFTLNEIAKLKTLPKTYDMVKRASIICV